MMPKQREIEIPLLKCLHGMGGRGKPRDIYPMVTTSFPTLTETDLAEALTSGGNKWINRIQWVRQTLVSKAEMESPEYGVWAITEKGQKRLALEAVQPAPLKAAETDLELRSPYSNLEELVDDYSNAFEEKIIQQLQDLSPRQFERFAGVLLASFGFTGIVITGTTGDGGIDGYGKLRVGLATMNAAFQCKRWQGAVGRPEIDKFRGAIQGEFEQGIFFTTSDFSSQARGASIKKGAAPIILLNGQTIVRLMVAKGLGIRRRPVELYEDDIDSLFDGKS